MSTKETKTKEELEKNAQTVAEMKAQFDALVKEQKEVVAKLESEEYKDFGYSADATIPLKPEMFWGIMNIFNYCTYMLNNLLHSIFILIYSFKERYTY